MRRIVLLALALVAVIAFTAEPSTSTEADQHDGRAHAAYMHPGAAAIRVLHAAGDYSTVRTSMLVVVLAALAALLSSSGRTHVIGPRLAGDVALLRWAKTARRGPPARA